MWGVLNEINDLIKEEPIKYRVNVEEFKKKVEVRKMKERFRETIRLFLRKYNKDIGMLTKEDVMMMTEGLNSLQKSMFMDEVKFCLETNRGKPIKWIIENNKSLLFKK